MLDIIPSSIMEEEIDGDLSKSYMNPLESLKSNSPVNAKTPLGLGQNNASMSIKERRKRLIVQ
jgi:hypothetical protein